MGEFIGGTGFTNAAIDPCAPLRTYRVGRVRRSYTSFRRTFEELVAGRRSPPPAASQFDRFKANTGLITDSSFVVARACNTVARGM